MPLLMLEMRVPGTKKCSATTWNARVMLVSTHLLGRVEQRAHVRRSPFPQVLRPQSYCFRMEDRRKKSMVGLRVKVRLGVQENGGSRPFKVMHLESKNKL